MCSLSYSLLTNLNTFITFEKNEKTKSLNLNIFSVRDVKVVGILQILIHVFWKFCLYCDYVPNSCAISSMFWITFQVQIGAHEDPRTSSFVTCVEFINSTSQLLTKAGAAALGALFIVVLGVIIIIRRKGKSKDYKLWEQSMKSVMSKEIDSTKDYDEVVFSHRRTSTHDEEHENRTNSRSINRYVSVLRSHPNTYEMPAFVMSKMNSTDSHVRWENPSSVNYLGENGIERKKCPSGIPGGCGAVDQDDCSLFDESYLGLFAESTPGQQIPDVVGNYGGNIPD